MKQLIVGAIMLATIGTWLVWFSAYIQRHMAEDEIMRACNRVVISGGDVQFCYAQTVLRRGGLY